MSLELATFTAMSRILGGGMTSELMLDATRELIKQISSSKKKYEERVVDLRQPIEIRRQELLTRISKLQYEVLLTLNQSEVMAKIAPVLLDSAGQVYEANKLAELNFIELTLDQIQATLENYRTIIRRRAAAKRWAILVTVLGLGALGGLIYWGTLEGGPSSNTVLPIVELPLPVLVWSAVGSFVAMLYRFNASGNAELRDPVRWLVTRPVVGVAVGAISYFVVKLGLLSVDSSTATTSGELEVVWLVAFLAGFSDRFAEGLLRSLVGRFGGKEEDDLVSIDASEGFTLPSALAENLQSAVNWSRTQASGLRPGRKPEGAVEASSEQALDSAGEKELASDDEGKTENGIKE